MDLISELEADCSAVRLFGQLDDLSRYPEWLTIVARADADLADGTSQGEQAWTVDLRGRFGRLARSKRLRMVRTAYVAPHHCRFERRELDGRDHSAWVLDVQVSDLGNERSKLVMSLHYGGGFGGALIEKMLRDEIERSRPTLLDLVRV